MSIEIEIVSGASSAAQVAPLLARAMPGTPEVPPDLRVIVEADGVAVCQIGLIRRTGVWRERPIRIGGVSGLVTDPDFRRQGLGSLALDAALHTLRDERSNDFALLFAAADTAAFFTSRNWKPFLGEVFAEQNGARALFADLQPLVFYLKRAPQEGELDLCGAIW